MALLIHKENQKILWNIINNNPYIINHFVSQSPSSKENWFKQSMQICYEKYKTVSIPNTNYLNNINKEVLSYMINSIKNKNDSKPVLEQNMIQTPEIIKDNKADIYNNEFNSRQEEYNNMFKREMPKDIDFSEKETDSPLTSMDELVKRELENREKIFKETTFGYPVTTPKLNIDNNNNIKIDSIELQSETKDKKSVSWTLPSNDINEMLAVQKSEIYSLRLLIIELTNRIEKLEKGNIEKEVIEPEVIEPEVITKPIENKELNIESEGVLEENKN